MNILDKVKGLVTGETSVEDTMKDVAGEVAGNIDLSAMLGGLLGGKDFSLDTLGKTLLPVVKQIGGSEAKEEVNNVLGNLAKVVLGGIDEKALVKGVIDFLQKNNVGLDTILSLLKKIPMDPSDIIKFLGLLK